MQRVDTEFDIRLVWIKILSRNLRVKTAFSHSVYGQTAINTTLEMFELGPGFTPFIQYVRNGRIALQFHAI